MDNKIKEAKNYVRKIRNKLKREYAEKYLAAMLEKMDNPDYELEYIESDCSIMGKQAVRMTIDDILDF